MDTQSAGNRHAPSPEAAGQANAVLQQVLRRSTTDRAFRQRLLTDPSAAVAEFTGRPVAAIPESRSVKFVENEPGTVTVVLPKLADSSGELAENELEAVSGGTTTVVLVVCAVGLVDEATGNSISGAIADFFGY
jgi:hypothetical protein